MDFKLIFLAAIFLVGLANIEAGRRRGGGGSGGFGGVGSNKNSGSSWSTFGGGKNKNKNPQSSYPKQQSNNVGNTNNGGRYGGNG